MELQLQQEEHLSLSKFIRKYPQMAQSVYNFIASQIWYFGKHFKESTVSYNDDNGNIEITNIEIGDVDENIGREKELRQLNKFFAKMRVNVSKKIPSLFVGLSKIYSATDDCKFEWEIKSMVGKGVGGTAYSSCCNSRCTHVMKVEEGMKFPKKREKFMEEARLSLLFGEAGIGPDIISEYIGENIGIIIMEKLDITLIDIVNKYPNSLDKDTLDIIRQKYLTVMNKLHDLGYIHGDIHLGNVMLKIRKSNLMEDLKSGNYKLRLIDFGNSIKLQNSLGVEIERQRELEFFDKKCLPLLKK
jgi:hypothetical protein